MDNGAFLTYKNRDYVADVARRYLSDKFQWTPPKAPDETDAFMSVVDNALTSVAGMPDSARLTLSDLNKRAITTIRYLVIEPETLATTASSIESGSGGPPPLPVMDRGESASNRRDGGADGDGGDGDGDDDASFMAKLQELEQRRKVLWVPPVVAAPPASPAPASAPAASAPAAPMPILLAPPTPIAAPSVPFVIHGWDRDRRSHLARAAFVWNGRIPPTIAPTSLRVACVWLPSAATTADPTPYIRLQVTGAGRQVADVICGAAPGGANWHVWTPCSADLARLPALAPPWSLAVRTAEGHLLDLGNDDAVVQGASLYGGSLRLECWSGSGSGSGSVGGAACLLGDILHLYLINGDLVRARVSGRIGADILVDPVSVTEAAAFIGAEIVNVSRQVVVLLEGSMTTHQRERERARDS